MWTETIRSQPTSSGEVSLLPREPSSTLPIRNHQLQAMGVQGAGEAEQFMQLPQPLTECSSPDGSRGSYRMQSPQQNPNMLAAARGFPTDIHCRGNGE